MKKIISIFLITLLALNSLFAQGQMESKEIVKESVFTDDLGREVILPSVVTKVSPSGSMASAFLVSFDPNLFVGVTTKPSQDEKEVLGEEFFTLHR